MKKYILIICLLASFNICKAQPDCIFKYRVIGNIVRTNASDSVNVILEFPSPEFLMDYVDTAHGYNQIEIEKFEKKYDSKFETTCSSAFCGESNQIIN